MKTHFLTPFKERLDFRHTFSFDRKGIDILQIEIYEDSLFQATGKLLTKFSILRAFSVFTLMEVYLFSFLFDNRFYPSQRTFLGSVFFILFFTGNMSAKTALKKKSNQSQNRPILRDFSM